MSELGMSQEVVHHATSKEGLAAQSTFAKRFITGQEITIKQPSNRAEGLVQEIIGSHMESSTAEMQETQRVIDFFYNPDGEGYKAYTSLHTGIKKSIDAFETYANFLGDPTAALIEISLLPISHWEMYSQRKMSLV